MATWPLPCSGSHYAGRRALRRQLPAHDEGKYYLVAGHHYNRVVELTGLETMCRQQFTITLTPHDLAAVEA